MLPCCQCNVSVVNLPTPVSSQPRHAAALIGSVSCGCVRDSVLSLAVGICLAETLSSGCLPYVIRLWLCNTRSSNTRAYITLTASASLLVPRRPLTRLQEFGLLTSSIAQQVVNLVVAVATLSECYRRSTTAHCHHCTQDVSSV